MKLTSREKEIVRLCKRGLDNEKIADELGITLRTTEHRLRNIRSKILASGPGHEDILAQWQI